jgi:Adenylate and Guanylate cyclase catalytic domain
VQVFCLLETVYHAFDVIAKHRGVFKVETIGDSYVAVVGLPTPRYQHAVVMARFARDIRNKMVETVLELEKSLGPVRFIMRWARPICDTSTVNFSRCLDAILDQGTADLALRIGTLNCVWTTVD